MSKQKEIALGVALAFAGGASMLWTPPAQARMALHNCSITKACVSVGGGAPYCETWIDCDEGSWRVG